MISGSTILVMAGQGVVAPILPLYAREFGVNTAMVGLTLSVFGFARLVLNVPFGMLSDRHGRRLLLVGGPLVTAVGMLGSGLAGGIWVLLAWRTVAGAGSAAYMTGAQLYLIDISTPANRARFIGTNQGALLAGVSIGPGIGGLVAQWFGFRAPFYVVGVSALVAGAYAWWRLPETNHEVVSGSRTSPQQPRTRAAFRFALSADFVAVAAVTMAIFTIRVGGRGTMAPLLGTERFGMSPGALGGIFTATAVTGLFLIAPAAFLTDRLGRKATIVPGGLIAGAGLVLMAAAPSTFWFAAGIVLAAIGTGISGPAPAAYAGDIAPAELRGLAMGMYRSAGDVGFVLGPPILGAIADATNIDTALWANALLIVVASLWFGVRARETSGRKAAFQPPADAAVEAEDVPP